MNTALARRRPVTRCLILAMFALLALVRAAIAQPGCGGQWLPVDGLPGVGGATNQVRAVTFWDRDGAGPLPALHVAAGSFTAAGAVSANHIAAWDPSTRSWTALGTGIAGVSFPLVMALAVLPGGGLVAAGDFLTAGGVTVNRIAMWNGTTWSSLGTGMNGTVNALAVLPGGDLVAGGNFTTAGGVAANRIARWNGTSWSGLGTGVNDQVLALAAHPSGDLYAGGVFTNAGGVTVSYLARWNGSTWSALGSGVNAAVYALTVWNGDVITGGQFTLAGGAFAGRIARWNGSAWSGLGTGMDSSVRALTTHWTGELVAAGGFATAGGVTTNRVAKWNGTAWSSVTPAAGMDAGTVFALASDTPSTLLLAGGTFTKADDVAAAGVALSGNGNLWQSLGGGTQVATGGNLLVQAVAALPDGGWCIGGNFASLGGVSVNSIALWKGGSFSALGTGMNSSVNAIAVMPNGDIVAGGSFTTAGGVPANRIARWNGATWTSLGTGMTNGTVFALAVLPGGDLVAGGSFTSAGGVAAPWLARWNGTAWAAFGPSIGGPVYALGVFPNGDLLVGGVFVAPTIPIQSRNIARWNGTSWLGFINVGVEQGIWNGAVFDVAILDNGDVIAGGTFGGAGWFSSPRVARWDGANWWSVGGGITGISVKSLLKLPNGDLLVGGDFAETANHVAGTGGMARWNGSTWSTVGLGFVGMVNDLARTSSGDVLAGGFLYRAGSYMSPHFALWSETGAPILDTHPGAVSVTTGGTATFNAAISPGFSGLSRAWQLETAPGSGVYANLSAGAIPGGGGTVSLPVLSQPTPYAGVQTSVSVSAITAVLHNRRVRVVVTNACGNTVSNPALLTVAAPACYANCDGAGGLTSNDFQCFLDRFAASDPYANCDGSTGTPALTSNDFQCFLNRIAAGCP